MGRFATLRALLAATLLLALVSPAAAVAATPPDAFEAGAGDDSSDVARDITGLLAGFGTAPYTEAHTLDATLTPADEDWFRIDVSLTAWQQFESYLIEARTADSGVAPLVEVYGPDTTATVVATSDASPWFAGGASVSLVPEDEPPSDDPHTYYVHISPAPGSDVGTYTVRAKKGQMTRLAGADRFDTAVQISRERFNTGGPDSGAVIVASGETFADALAGATLAGVLKCPVLLTRKASLPGSVATEIARLGADTVYLLGGTGAVSAPVATAIAAVPGVTAVPRLSGATRVQTAAAIVRKASELAALEGGALPQLAFVCNSMSFPDALAASPVAAFTGAPVLLTGGAALDPAVAAALEDPDLGITDVIIAGGNGAVSVAAQTRIQQILAAKTGEATHVGRIGGATRYDTAKAVALWATRGGVGPGRFTGTTGSPLALPALDYNRIGVASGTTFPDALAGGIACGLSGAPILLTPPTSVSTAIFAVSSTTGDILPTCYVGASDWAILRSYVFGGTGALAPDTFTVLDMLVTGPGGF